MGSHIGFFYGPANFDCMKEKAEQKAVAKDHTRGSRIRTLRLALKLNQTELAALIGVDQSTVSDIENGAGFSADLLMRLSDSLKVSPGIVMRGHDESSWPFQHIEIQEVISLDGEERSFVEGRLAEYIGQVVPPKPLGGKARKPSAKSNVTKVQKSGRP